MRTHGGAPLSLPLAQAEHAIHMLPGEVPGVNPIHLAIEPDAPRLDDGLVDSQRPATA